MISLYYFIVLLRSGQTAKQALIHGGKESDRLGYQAVTAGQRPRVPQVSAGRARGSRNRLRGGGPGLNAVRGASRRQVGAARGSGMRPLSGMRLSGDFATHLCRSCRSSGRPGILGLRVGVQECNSESWAAGLLSKASVPCCSLPGVPALLGSPAGSVASLLLWDSLLFRLCQLVNGCGAAFSKERVVIFLNCNK